MWGLWALTMAGWRAAWRDVTRADALVVQWVGGRVVLRGEIRVVVTVVSTVDPWVDEMVEPRADSWARSDSSKVVPLAVLKAGMWAARWGKLACLWADMLAAVLAENWAVSMAVLWAD